MEGALFVRTPEEAALAYINGAARADISKLFLIKTPELTSGGFPCLRFGSAEFSRAHLGAQHADGQGELEPEPDMRYTCDAPGEKDRILS